MKDREVKNKKAFNILSSPTGRADTKRPFELGESRSEHGFVDPDDSYSDGRGRAAKKEKNDGDYGEDT